MNEVKLGKIIKHLSTSLEKRANNTFDNNEILEVIKLLLLSQSPIGEGYTPLHQALSRALRLLSMISDIIPTTLGRFVFSS